MGPRGMRDRESRALGPSSFSEDGKELELARIADHALVARSTSAISSSVSFTALPLSSCPCDQKSEVDSRLDYVR
jgi:hypothetical protein